MYSTTCHLLGGWFATFVQVFIGIIAMSSLVYKREYIENPKRPISIWLMDVSKQGISSIIIHFCNIGLSILFAAVNLTPDQPADECAFYFLSFVLDTIVGVYLIWVGLNIARIFAIQFDIKSIQEQGVYGYETPMTYYTHQLITFIIVILISKIILGIFMYMFSSFLNRIGNFIFEPLEKYPDIELVVVMVVCPCFLSMIQYWIQDNILMGKEVNRDNYVYLDDRDRRESLNIKMRNEF